jgi:death-on-curing protein
VRRRRGAVDQLRNQPGLESALARPAAYAHYENADLALQASALAHGIAEGQQFIDGNKRTALVAMLTFLEINGIAVKASDRELARLDPQLQLGRDARAGRAAHP